ncbi:MAG: hypothetical protein QOK43_2193 [Acidimicrobiaceae bacterium]|nr:hypothetical protein [Acidimicrobiaceae bacterium]
MDVPDRQALAAMFGEDYERFEFPILTAAATRADVDEILLLLGERSGQRLLDAPCGHGRHAVALASRGLRVTGADRSRRFLELARRASDEALVDITLCQADLADLPFRGGFDVAICWYGSFGYFGDDEDKRVLTSYHRALDPGGVLVVDLQSPYRMIPSLVAGGGAKTDVQRVGEDILFDTTTLDPITSRYFGERIAIVGSGVSTSRYSVRAFTVPEITSWLRDAGFAEVQVTGDAGEPFTVLSRRLRVLAYRS